MGVRCNTTRFGELDIPPERIITFPCGLIGFGVLRDFVLVDHPGGGPFQWLQSVERPELAFVITDPKLFFPDYAVAVKEEDLRQIGITDPAHGVVVVILVVPHDPRRITANLQGPIVINLKERLGRQLVLDVPRYTTRHPIFSTEREPVEQSEEASC
jgi:flagellar assembly factor FliW